MVLRFIVLFLMFSLLNAFTSTPYTKNKRLVVQGQMISLKDASKLSLEVENYAIGQYMIAKNPRTGEVLKGQYIINRSGSSSKGVVTNNYGFQTGQINTSSSSVSLKGVLSGNKGTVINLTIYMGAGAEKFFYPGTWHDHTYYGEAIDNHGTKYQIHMSGVVVAKDLSAIQ